MPRKAATGPNSRNGIRSKTVLTEIGPVEIDVPRDTDASFEPQIVRKRQRRWTGVDEIVLSLTARGLTTGEISAHFAEVYGASISKDTISKITDKVVEEMNQWCSRPLDSVYPVIFIDAIVVKVRDGQVRNKPIYVVLGVTVHGERDILGLWAGDGGEGAKFWLQRKRKRPRNSYRRWERPGPMQLWQLDIVGGVWLVDTTTGVLREVKVVTGVDDHSRFCVIASVVERATGRAVCLALAAALARYGVPEEILSDNGKQFTGRFSQRGEVLFDKICRHNGITHRLTQPASPTTTGKIERFHLTLRRELLDDHEPFESIEAAQAAVDAFVAQYNTHRPHQALDPNQPVSPADRFSPAPHHDSELLPVWLPPTLAAAPTMAAGRVTDGHDDGTDPAPPGSAAGSPWTGGPVEFDRVVPPSGNLQVAGRQFWLGPVRAGQMVRFWADCDLIHLLIGGTRVKTVRSHLTVTDLARLVAEGAVTAGPPPLPPAEPGDAVEVERVVSRGGTVVLGGQVLLAAEILGGRRIGIRIEPDTLMFYDLDTRELLRVRPNPLTLDKIRRLRGNRPAGPPPRPSTEPIRVQRRASNTGVIMVCGQKVALGRIHQHRTVTVHVSDTTLAIELDDGETRVVRRTTTLAVRNIKANRPRPVTPQVVSAGCKRSPDTDPLTISCFKT